jgi:hypothetical protein
VSLYALNLFDVAENDLYRRYSVEFIEKGVRVWETMDVSGAACGICRG